MHMRRGVTQRVAMLPGGGKGNQPAGHHTGQKKKPTKHLGGKEVR